MSKKIALGLLVVSGILFSGCSTSNVKVKTKFVKEKRYNYERYNNPEEFRYQPVIGTKQDDTKIMIDMGQWAKIWVKNYKNRNDTYVASHSIVTKIREPGFIAGEEVPRYRRDATYNANGGRSFSFKSKDLIYQNSSMGSRDLSDNQIKEYVNNYQYSKHTKRLPPQKAREVQKKNDAIKAYMKKKLEEREKEKQKKEQERADRVAAEKAHQAEIANEKSDAQYISEDEKQNGSLK